jgi:hypothetical protein
MEFVLNKYDINSKQSKQFTKIVKKHTNKHTYNENLIAIEQFFHVSKKCAKYMYHRRRRGYPYNKNKNENYIIWTIQLQNALIKADLLIEWDWSNIIFQNDIKTLQDHGIYVNKQPYTIYKNNYKQYLKKELIITYKNENENENENENNGWTIVSLKKKVMHKYMLRKMGFLQFENTIYKSKT